MGQQAHAKPALLANLGSTQLTAVGQIRERVLSVCLAHLASTTLAAMVLIKEGASFAPQPALEIKLHKVVVASALAYAFLFKFLKPKKLNLKCVGIVFAPRHNFHANLIPQRRLRVESRSYQLVPVQLLVKS